MRLACLLLCLGLASACRSKTTGAVECGPGLPACAGDNYCDYEPGLCGQGQRSGLCKARPEACAGDAEPVCGCDRKVYPSACAARAAGVDISVNGGCGEVVAGRIQCGFRYCDARTSYCEIVQSDVRELPSYYTCKPLPEGCADCACLPAGTRCADFCSPVESGGARGLRLTCVGGY